MQLRAVASPCLADLGMSWFTWRGMDSIKAGKFGEVRLERDCQVSPLQWPPTRMRRVLNHAFSDFISDDMLDAAAAALDMGYEGSLSRCA